MRFTSVLCFTEFEVSPVRTLTLSACPNISAAARSNLSERTLKRLLAQAVIFETDSSSFCVSVGGIAVLDDPDFCSELVEAEVAAEVYNKLELLGQSLFPIVVFCPYEF